MINKVSPLLCLSIFLVSCSLFPAGHASPRFYVTAIVDQSTVKMPNTPCELTVDFGSLLRELNVGGEFDRNSVVVEGKNPKSATYEPVDYRLSEHYKYGTSGTVSWVIRNPQMTEFRIGFDTKKNPPWPPREYIPAIGNGDELMFNTAEPAPLLQMDGALLQDYNGDGLTDVMVNSSYSNTFGWPYDGIFFYPGFKSQREGVTVTDFYRIHYISRDGTNNDLRILHAYYNWVYPVDWDKDGLMDLLFVSTWQERQPTGPERAGQFGSGKFITFFRNTGQRDISGFPILRESKQYDAEAITKGAYVPAIAAEDLDGDGRVDLLGLRTSADNGTPRLASVLFYRNASTDANGVPNLAEPITMRTVSGDIAGFHASALNVSFGDVNGDGKIDIIGTDDYLPDKPTFWYENKGGSPPVFLPRRKFEGLPLGGGYRWVRWNGNEGLMGIESGDLFRRIISKAGFSFAPTGSLRVVGGLLLGGTQEKVEWVDWNNDGDLDLVAGEASGRIHLYENVGTRKYPRFKAPVWITSEGEPIRIYRDGVFGGHHWHGAMGYPSVACVDWDQDGLFDLVIPNETNRVFWYKNIGSPGHPKFGTRQQILPDGYVESPEKLERSRVASADLTLPNNPYVYLEDEPFFWRTRIAIADYTGDGLLDMIAKNGAGNVVLYERYRDSKGELRLKPGVQMFYDDGTPLTKDTAPFYKLRAVDWDGDGRVDLVAGQGWGKPSLLFLRNVGTTSRPVFAKGEPLKLWGVPIIHSNHGLQASFIDWDGDGKLDLVGCNESGHYLFFRNAALTQVQPHVALGKPAGR